MKKLPDKIALLEFVEQWPRDNSGMLAHRLMLNLLGTVLIESAVTSSAKRSIVQAQIGAHKALAKMIENLRLITAAKPEARKITPMKPLHQMRGQTPEKPEPTK